MEKTNFVYLELTHERAFGSRYAQSGGFLLHAVDGRLIWERKVVCVAIGKTPREHQFVHEEWIGLLRLILKTYNERAIRNAIRIYPAHRCTH